MRRQYTKSKYLVCTLLFCSCGETLGNEPYFTLSTGLEHVSGSYGGESNIEEVYLPVTMNYISGSYGYGLTVPYLSVRAPSGTIITNSEGKVVVGEGPITTESGLGDITTRITFYDLLVSESLDMVVDASAKVKFGTADETKGLGTGETDYSLQTDIYKFFDGYYINASVGYKLRGDSSGLDFNNVWFGSVGANYRFSTHTKVGATFSYRQSSFENREAIQELSIFVSNRIDNSWGIQLYSFKGFSDSSPDLGAGALLKYYL
jgi:hypothetical protein